MFIIMFSSLPCQVVAEKNNTKTMVCKEKTDGGRRNAECGMWKRECERGKAERAKHKGF